MDEARYFNRELSTLDFQDRVLALAENPNMPLLERVKFLAIVSSNLDEFFQVRVAGLMEQRAAGVRRAAADGRTPGQQLEEIAVRTHDIVGRKDRLFEREIVPALAEATVDIRTREPDRWEEVTTAMREITAGVSGDTGAEVELLVYNHRPGIIWDAETDRLLALARNVGSELSIDIEAFASVAAGSSAFSDSSTVVLDGLGPVGAGLMTQSEHIEIDSLVPRAALLAHLIHRLPTLLKAGKKS